MNLNAAFAELAARFGERFSTNATLREQHGHGESNAVLFPPDGVIWPETTAEVAEIVRLCVAHRVPMVPFGAGTSLEGHIAAVRGGLCIDLSRMDQLLQCSPEDLDCTVQPGITREGLNHALRETGLFFPVDPGANASIGGMTSTRASGTTTVRYGGMSANVLALEVVTPQGEVVRLGSRARKTSAGYDLVHLMTGAEGTLGIITAITLRLHPRPEAVGTLTCAYPAMRPAVDTVIELVQLGAPLARMEFIDEVAARACNAWSGTSLPEAPTLFIEFHGTPAGVAEQLERAREVVHGHGASAVSTTTDEQEIAKLWRARHTAYHAGRALRPGSEAVTGDVAVPVSRLADNLVAAREDLDAEGLTAVIVGHVGDGNFHVLFLHDPAPSNEADRVNEVYARMIARAQADGGTCTGEHGVGLGKRDKLQAEFGAGTLQLMRAIKQAWDPLDLMNPGKILPDA